MPDYQEYLELQELNPFRYRGYVYDTETGWYYLQSRYYDPEVGRFLSADVLLSTGQGVLGHNTFAYCGNNSVSRCDPSGCTWWDDLCDWVEGAAEKVVEAVDNLFDTATTVERAYEAIDVDLGLIGYDEGYCESSTLLDNVDSGAPITLYGKEATENWKVWEYGCGIDVKHDCGSFYYGLDVDGKNVGGSLNGTSLEFSFGAEKTSINLTVEAENYGQTAGYYYSFFIRPWAIALATVVVYTAVALLSTALAPAVALAI